VRVYSHYVTALSRWLDERAIRYEMVPHRNEIIEIRLIPEDSLRYGDDFMKEYIRLFRENEVGFFSIRENLKNSQNCPPK
jgi:hypothetical protein